MQKRDKKQPLRVGFYGPVSQISGYGTAARTYVHALHRAGVEVSVIDLDFFGPDLEVKDPLVHTLLDRRIEPDFHIIHYFHPQIAKVLSLYLDRVILMTTWETDILPAGWKSILNHVREVWVPCDYNISIFEKHLTVPIFKWPHAIPPRNESLNSGCVPVPEISESDFVFYSIFMWQNRKYPEGIIEAFLRAFPSDADVILVLKVVLYGTGIDPGKVLEEVRQRTRSNARVLIIQGMWSEGDMESLARRGDCYVSLHRSEGWCYPLFDAACCGKPVIATGYSGPLEYLAGMDGSLVRYKLQEVEERDQWFHPPMKWAQPDLEHATELMRYVYEHREEASSRARTAAEELKVRYSLESVGLLAVNHLSQLYLESSAEFHAERTNNVSS